ncbi:CAP domain-containing protein [Paenibacillus guangzhouensis]|uniref:CAP domain-containing protein n=1 Tax=Paenibacillus guangzhouensis TaxID=1473112 RepID=UPI0012675C48|nr:CAP domain-containing protein [Paenibacillus guangzhouensis]
MKKVMTRFSKAAMITAVAVAAMVPTAASAASAPTMNDVILSELNKNLPQQYSKVVTVPTIKTTTEKITVTVKDPKKITIIVKVPSNPTATKPVTKPVTKPTKPTTQVPQVTVPVQPKPTQPTKPTPPTNNVTPTESEASFAAQVVNLVNQERAKQGLAALSVDTPLAGMAMDKAVDMYTNNYFSHQSPTYGSPFDMMRQYNIKYGYAGENVAKGQRSPQEVMNSWMNSQGHRANILNKNFTHIGVAYHQGIWVQEFISKA